MRRIIFGLILIAGASAAIATGATGAFFSDTQTSNGNTFQAGAIQLKIDNESYYNGAVSSSTTWTTPSSLNNSGLLFFNFKDIKPGDTGEDTISLHVDNNPAYACLDVTLTSNTDATSTQSELAESGPPDNPDSTWEGDLAQNLQMFWWADDGDNVYEQGEGSLSGGVQTLYSLATSTPFSATLADSQNNAWTGQPGPIPAGQTKYIGKAWCFGTLTATPVPQDGLGHQPNSSNGPLVRGSGFACNGQALDNTTQMDGATLDVAFRAIQARHNDSFTCSKTPPRLATIKVIKVVNNIHGGNNVVPDFHLFVDNGSQTIGVTSGVPTTVTPGTYAVEETGVSGYAASFTGDCDSEGNVTLSVGDNKTCTITNTDLPANITMIKVVDSGLADPSTFKMRVDGTLVPNTTSIAVTSNAPHTITEDAKLGYHFVSMTGAGCPAVLGGTATLNEGQAITCTIHNAHD